MTTDNQGSGNKPGEIPPEQSLIEYPSHFPIKVMGTMQDGFAMVEP